MLRAARTCNTDEAGRGIASVWSGHLKRVMCTGLGLVLLLALAFVPAGRSQAPPGSNDGLGSMGRSFPEQQEIASPDNYDAIMMERRLRAMNAERQKLMVADANKLLKLARELNDEVASSKSDSFTPDQLHKIAEIEKLAHSVKDRMAGGVGAVQPAPLIPTPLMIPVH